MYFCPCSCSKADGENEEDVLIYLPRNLSYAGESYLDRYSVSSAFVHNNKLEKQLLQADVNDQYLRAGAAACKEAQQAAKEQEGEAAEQQQQDEEEAEESDHLLGARAMARPVTCSEDTPFRGGGGPDSCDVRLMDSPMALPPPTTSCSMTSTPFRPPLTVSIERDKNSTESQPEYDQCAVKTVESPDSDLVSEEGIFVNMMDDLEGLGGGASGKLTLSEASDDTYVSGDSMYYSPVEVEEMEDEQVRGDFKVSLEEAVQQAAFNFQGPNFTQNHEGHQQSPEDKDASPPQEDKTDTPPPPPHKDDCQKEEVKENGEGHSTDKKDEGKEEDAQQSSDSASPPQPTPLTVVTATVASSDVAKPAVSSPRKPTTGLEIMVNDRAFQNDDRGPLSSSYRDLLSPDSPLYEDREFNFARTELRKSTSLKSTKTPPGTPRRKKVVRFADAMGLDLESVRHVLNLESPPKIPPSAMKDLQTGLSEERKTMGSKFITETFTQPGADLHFRDRVLAEKVVLENALIVSGSITGVVRVANVAFHKTVRVRFTTNGWASFHDIAASYMINSNDGATDRFSFTLVPPSDFSPGCKLECAISYSCNGVDYWDNNFGKNYVFECYAKTIPTEAENAWMHFL